MCGIVGWITTHTTASAERRKFFEQALVIDTLRGDDSTGMFLVAHEQDKSHRDGAAAYGKVTRDGYAFINSDTYKSVMGDNNGRWRAVVGHNRAATIGGVSIETAHPFEVGPITLVHNGTIRDMTHMKFSDLDSESHNDSHAIARNLAAVPPGGESVIEDLDGAFALVWHDARDDKIRIVRNKERPLHMAVCAQGNNATLYFASEAGMLAWLLKRNGITTGPIFEPKPGVHMTFEADPREPAVKQLDLWKPAWTYYNTYTPQQYRQPAGFISHSGKAPSGVSGTHGTGNEDKVAVLGGTRVLPTRLAKTLADFGLDIKLPMTFCPRYSVLIDWGDPKRIRHLVGGEIIDVGQQYHQITAVLYNVPDSVAKQQMSHMWTVRPVGVKFGADWQPIVVCKLVSFTKCRSGETVDVAYWDAIQKQRDTDAAELREMHDDPWGDATYPGPHGSQLRADEWLQETSGGCGWCGKQLSLLDADEVEWANERTMPVCPECIEDISEVVLN